MSKSFEDYNVKEGTHSTGGLCGGTYIVKQCNKFLLNKIQCLPQFLRKSLAFMGKIFKRWEEIKCSFGRFDTIGDSFKI